MRLWPVEFDALRDEAQAAVAAAMTSGVMAGLAARPKPADRATRVRQNREYTAGMVQPSPSAIERTLAGVRCRTFVPERPARAVYLHFHGGGMVLGVPEMNDIGNQALSEQRGVAVVSVDYRLAPEHPYPAGPDDGVAVAGWLLEHANQEYGTDRILIGGESAGGYMAAAVLLRIRDELHAADRVIGANLVFGVYDWGRSPSQRGIRPQQGPDVLDPEGIDFFTDCYLPGLDDTARRDPAISPAFADLRGLPPALMSVGSCDHLLDDTLLLASRWAAAENEVELFVAPDMPHGFGAIPCELTRRWMQLTGRWFAERLAPTTTTATATTATSTTRTVEAAEAVRP